MIRLKYLLLLILLAFVGCQEQAVRFAPTPAPQDTSSLRFFHPSGAFTIDVPREWSVYTQSTAQLASAYFTPTGQSEPVVGVAVINWQNDDTLLDLSDVVNAYQQEVRPDVGNYTEQERQLIGDGSWRLVGIRTTSGGLSHEVNTFIEQSGTFIAVTDVLISNQSMPTIQLEAIINSLAINPNANMQPTTLSTLGTMNSGDLEILNVSTWSTPGGVYFITGEVINRGFDAVGRVPIRVVLQTPEGNGVAEALDMLMGYSVRPGEFAPFSLRFGQGQPQSTTLYEITLGDESWFAEKNPVGIVLGAETLTWTDEPTFTDDGALLVDGIVTNTGTQTAYDLIATITVFDGARNVIAAGFTDVIVSELAPEASAQYHLRVNEMGGTPVDYIVNVQGLPESGS